MVYFHVRGETKNAERRTAITPADAKLLVDAGHRVTVESWLERCFTDAEYLAVGCELLPAQAWEKGRVARDAVILGLKELPEGTSPLPHKHIMFAHCFKDQDGWEDVMGRFLNGKGQLFDLEFLHDAQGRRKCAFGKSAGFCGMGTGFLAWAQQHASAEPMTKAAFPADIFYPSREAFIDVCKKAIESTGKTPKVMIIGAQGRCGTGAADMARAAGVPDTHLFLWDMAETAKGGPFEEILECDIFVNCIYLNPTSKTPPFLTEALVDKAGRACSVLVDVSCDPNNPKNPVPVYNECTTFQQPVLRVRAPTGAQKPLDVVAIDHLPSLVPSESSAEFSAALVPMLLDFEGDSEKVWRRALGFYHATSARMHSNPKL
eukprot:TRINITY_DN1148_c0_g1_i1.p1 TRINITY_DN1148_c0_g1~~TRINITY_DN1148_c0_g1_i1.p1  ORF type:complete len:375 (+),score=161.77 TRINITY_DN1148_c0_g1_i1:69-1193(+)